MRKRMSEEEWREEQVRKRIKRRMNGEEGE